MRNRKFYRTTAWAVLATVASGASVRAASITITPTFDSSITTNANAAGIEAGINNAIAEIESKIGTSTSTPLSVSITFANGTSGLGQSSQSLVGVSYVDYRAALAARSTSANDALALSNLPNTTTFNGYDNMALSMPHARALGFGTNPDNATITLNTSLMNLSRSGTLNPGLYDLQTVAMHEIDEVLGVGGPATSLGQTYSASYLGSLDVFRYSAPGTLTHSTSASSAYFSIDSGVTNVMSFNQGSGADYADWLSNSTHYVQDAFGTPGTYRDLATPELTAYDVIGYTLVPEPMACSLIGLGAIGVLRRRRGIVA
ncbi:MAG: NF038122 family metalloprotease [Tepidisphaeraceae bacterium]